VKEKEVEGIETPEVAELPGPTGDNSKARASPKMPGLPRT